MHDDAFELAVKRSKTDIWHAGIQIVLVTTEKTCPVPALRRLLIQGPKPVSVELIRLSSGASSLHNVVIIL